MISYYFISYYLRKGLADGFANTYIRINGIFDLRLVTERLRDVSHQDVVIINYLNISEEEFNHNTKEKK